MSATNKLVVPTVVTDEEAEYLIHLAIEMLIHSGTIQLQDQESAQDELP